MSSSQDFARKRVESKLILFFISDSPLRDLADIRKEGNLTRDEFAVAMYLIRSKISGKGLPESLPASLVPPSLRQASAAAPGESITPLVLPFSLC